MFTIKALGFSLMRFVYHSRGIVLRSLPVMYKQYAANVWLADKTARKVLQSLECATGCGLRKLSPLLLLVSIVLHAAEINGVADIAKITAPSSPPASFGRLYIDSGTNLLGCKNSDGSSCITPATTSLAFSAITTGTNTAATMTVGTGASLTFSGTGTVNAGLLNGTSLAGLATGLLKNTTATGVPSIAAASDVINLWSGTCNVSTVLGGNGACVAPVLTTGAFWSIAQDSSGLNLSRNSTPTGAFFFLNSAGQHNLVTDINSGGGNVLNLINKASGGVSGLKMSRSSDGVEFGVIGGGNTGIGAPYLNNLFIASDTFDIQIVQGGSRMLFSRSIANGGTGDITIYAADSSTQGFVLRGATGNVEMLNLNATMLTTNVLTSASNMTILSASGTSLTIGPNATAAITMPANGLTMTLKGNLLQSGALDTTNGQLKLQATNNDQSSLTLWPKASSPDTNSRVWMMASNADNFGNLELFVSSTNAGSPTTKVLEILRTGAAIFSTSVQSSFKSSDGTSGITATCTILSITSITVKNGLITACS